jgi:hypothetical protein
MKAVVLHGVGDIPFDNVREPQIEASTATRPA